MATTVNLANAPIEILTGNDSIVLPLVLDTIDGGRSLNVTGFTPDVIPGGHIIIRETASNDYKPAPIDTNGKYAVLPTGHEYVGVQIGSVLKTKPFGSICIMGRVNPDASVYDLTPILSAVKTALPRINFNSY